MSTKRRSTISFGPGASSLILIFVVLAMSVLGVLSLMNSRNDVKLSERSVQVAQAVYALHGRAEEKRAQLDALVARYGADRNALSMALPEDVEMEGNILSFTETDGLRRLSCALEITPEGEDRTVWTRYDLTAVTGEGEWEDD
ncbi:MAG: hypothetical protein IJ189_09215 [Clostridia bacterium]|nr:hypothetical protein [Clostridia bacterium]